MQKCRSNAPDKMASMDRWTDGQTDGQPWGFQYTPPLHYGGIINGQCIMNALDNNDLVKFTSSRGDNSATNDSMVMKIAHAELYTTSNIVCNFEFSTCNTVGLFLLTTIIQ